MANADLIHAVFSIHTIPNEAKSKAAGRPIWDEMEIVTLRFSANKQTVAVFPAHEVFKWEVNRETGVREPMTYAIAYPEQYRRFKANEAQTQSGTPLSELPFLTAGKRLELKALSIHTAEALASLDGQNLKNLGMQGREMVNQAKAYLANAAGSSNVTKLAAENVDLKEQMAALQQQFAQMVAEAKNRLPTLQPEPQDKALEDCTDAELKAFIKRETGAGVPGNPSRQTLLDRAMEIATAPEMVA